MRTAAIRIFVFAMLALCGWSSSAAVATVQVDPIETVTSVISTIASQTTVVSDVIGQTTVVSDLTGSGTSGSSGSGGTGSSETDGSSGTARSSDSGAASGASSGGDDRSTADGSRRTRFDSLPRRYEILLERIESGHDVRASIARLRALLASASPRLRARVLRAIRMEIRRLEQSGLTRREQTAVQRLRRLLATLEAQAPQPTISWSLRRFADAGVASGTAGGVLSARAGSQPDAAGRPRTSGRKGAGHAIPGVPLPTPGSPSNPLYGLLLLLLLAVTGLVWLLTLVPENALPSPVRGIVIDRRIDIRLFALVSAMGGVLGLVVVLLAG
jgi:hypothetical protein